MMFRYSLECHSNLLFIDLSAYALLNSRSSLFLVINVARKRGSSCMMWPAGHTI